MCDLCFHYVVYCIIIVKMDNYNSIAMHFHLEHDFDYEIGCNLVLYICIHI